MIRLKDVSKTYTRGTAPVAALADVTLDIPTGEIFGIIGYSGAGKSTLIRLLNGLEKPTTGTVEVAGRVISHASERELRQARLKIGMIFQHFNLLWSRNVRQNIAFPLEIAGLDRATINRRVDELIGLVGLTGRENAYPSQLSGGQKQRVGIARALANNPDVLLSDEATSALDPQTTDQILDLLADINKRLNLTIVMITHEMHVVSRIGHRVAVMEGGRVVEEGPVADVFGQPQQEVTQRFIRQLSGGDQAFDLSRVDLTGASVLRVVYDDSATSEPVLSEVIRRFDLGVSILHARINQTAAGHAGEMHISVPVTGADLDPVLSYFRDRGIQAEVLRA